MNHNRLKKFDLFFLFLIILVSGYFRFTNLAHNPGVYNDEGTLLNISINLYEGNSEYLGIRGSWLLAGRMPVLPWLLSLSYSFFEPGLLVLRTLTASSGVLAVALLFLFLKKISSRHISYLEYLAPLVLALHPKFVLFNRIGFGYNLLIPLTILIIWLLWSYHESQNKYWLILASLLVGIGALIELAYVAFFVFLYLWIILFDPKKLFLAVPVSMFPLLLYFLISFTLFGESFLFDWQTTFERGTSNSFFVQLAVALINTFLYVILADISLLIGIIGSITIQDRKLGITVFFGILIPTFVIGRTFFMFNQSFYYFMPYIPFVAIGISALVRKVIEEILKFSDEISNLYIPQILQNIINKIKVFIFSWIMLITIITPASLLVLDLNSQVNQKLRTSFDHLLIDMEEFNQLRNYLSKTIRETETVIASPAIAWAINANATDYQISIAVNREPTIHFPNGIPKDRMRFASDMDVADYVIIDPILQSWENNHIPNIEDWVEQIETGWIPVFQTKSIVVYRNPNLSEK